MKISLLKNVKVVNPLNHAEFVDLLRKCKLVITDSGGIQEETTFLRIPCLTLRKNTERPSTIDIGTNILVDTAEEVTEQLQKIEI